MNAFLLIVCGILLLSSMGILWWSWRSRNNPDRITQQRLHNILSAGNVTENMESSAPFSKMLKRLGASQSGQHGRLQEWWREMRVLLTQAGYYDRDTRAMLKGGMVLAPFVGAFIAAAAVMGAGGSARQNLAAVFLGFSAGLLLPRYALRFRARRRREEIIEEVPVMVRMISVLFEAGLSLEVALKTLRDNGGGILPNLSVEIGRMLARVESGLGRVEALNQMANELDIQEFTDAVSVLSHTAMAGGSVRQSLTRIAEAIEDTNRTRLRERVGKLSAKMTVVMVVFLFPALFIFLAGPGLVAIAGALGGMR